MNTEPGSLPCSGPSSSASSVSSASLPSPPGSPMMHNHLQDAFVHSDTFQQEVQGKLITLEELVRMRRVLTAASLENLPLDSSIKDDVAGGKVCFVCRKTRFSVFNTKTWWHNCKLCRRAVCIKCCSKVNKIKTIALLLRSLNVRWKSRTIKAQNGPLYCFKLESPLNPNKKIYTISLLLFSISCMFCYYANNKNWVDMGH